MPTKIEVSNEEGHCEIWFSAPPYQQGYDNGFMKYTKPLPAKHYGRIFYNLETSDPAGSGYMHASFVTADTAQQVRVVDTVRCSTGGCSGKQQFLYNWADDQGGKASPYDYTPNVGVWSCAEWHVDAATQTPPITSPPAAHASAQTTGGSPSSSLALLRCRCVSAAGSAAA